MWFIPDDLVIIPDFLIAVLAAWLGASVISRNPRENVSRIFGLLTLLAALWGATRVVGRLSHDSVVKSIVASAEAGIATLLPAALLHIVLAVAVGRRLKRTQRAALISAYVLGLVIGFLSVSDREHPIAIDATARELLGLPGPAVGWAWIAFRALVFVLASWWAWRAWHAEPHVSPRRGQLMAVLIAVVCGATGGILTILTRQVGGPGWAGPSLIVVSLGLAAYAAFVRRVFFAPDVARRSFVYSLITGVLTAGYVALLLGLERVSRRLLGIDTPLLTALALVLTIALFDPARERFRSILDRRSERRNLRYSRLLRALSDDLLTAPHPDAAIEPALAQLCRSLGLRGAAVAWKDGTTIARYGTSPSAETSSALAFPLQVGGKEAGQVTYGPKATRLPFTREETNLLGNATAFVAASVTLAERQATQTAELDALSRERAALRSQEAALAEALTSAQTPGDISPGLRVHALGPLRVERDGAPIQRWGGAKAGTRQAQAMFAFLYDRAERGVAKDEFLEVIWPDVPLDKADLAFHRTLGGLRRTLEPDLKRGSEAVAISYHNDRYHLDRAIIAWDDVTEFEERMRSARDAADAQTATAVLEEARKLYRGDYLDDCPFYGDSLYVEERRSLLRGRFIDVLLALGERYETRGDGASAAACFREALRVAGDDCPRADDGLARLGLPL